MNKLRILLLSALILVLLGAGLPVTESLAKWGRSSVASRKKQKQYRRHSRAWWRRYRARQRARRERAMLRRRLRAERLASNPQRPAAAPASVPVSFSRAAGARPPAARAPQLPFQLALPHTWGDARRASNGDTHFNVRTPDGRAAGTAVISAVKMSGAEAAQAPSTPRSKSVGGMPVTALRRTVIDRMVAEGGWVTNDMVREIQGRRVFVVFAQTGAPGAPTQSWSFYFTEVDGRIYSLATNTPIEFAGPVASGSEQVMASLKSSGSSNLAEKQQQ
ncbi:MAG TPA: hypothetical protein VFS10_17555 [Pyrinomonadaceae bacterium]|nr:hypothetical protein [Pyrinomonadaceae bacterium]